MFGSRMMKMALLVLAVLSLGLTAQAQQHTEDIFIEDVWAGHPVGFALLTHAPMQFAAYYNADRDMVVVSRYLHEREWTRVVLPEAVVWDSHNYITMTVDDDGYVHLSGNMHVDPLVYFRTQEPMDITTFERIPSMVGTLENRVTYPRFLRGPDNILLYNYRDGSSGSGNEVYNRYDHATQTWHRLLDEPLVDGEGQRNAYFDGPHLGPDGYFHMSWVWRDSYLAETNSHPSYARSKDLVHWENSRGEALELPITYATSDVVDPVPPLGGIINGNVKVGFDLDDRVIVSYHKYDEDGLTQLYNARSENGEWVIYQSSDWDYRWEFGGGGSIPFEVRVQPVQVEEDGTLAQTWGHSQYGTQRWRLDPDTLQPVERLELPPNPVPAALRGVRSDFPGMQVRIRHDSGEPEADGVYYFLRWETLGQNRDLPREEPWPEPSQLELYRIVESEVELITDAAFQRGFTVLDSPEGAIVELGEIQYDPAQGSPIWTLAQWNSRFNILDGEVEILPSGSHRFYDDAKSVIFGPEDSEDGHLVFQLDSNVEYEGRHRDQGEPWPHLLTQQRISPPDTHGYGGQWLHELTEIRLNFEAILRHAERLDGPDYTPTRHTAHFLMFFLIQNLNPASDGYGDFYWLGVPIWDERYEVTHTIIIPGDQGLGKLIYTPSQDTYTNGSLHSGNWETFNADLLPLIYQGLEEAWDRDFLQGSQDPGDYKIGGMNLGWEIPGLSNAEVQVRDLSLIMKGPWAGVARDWSEADAWPWRTVPTSGANVELRDALFVTDARTVNNITGPGWDFKSATLTIAHGGEIQNNGRIYFGIGAGVTGTLLLDRGSYVGNGEIHAGRPLGQHDAGHGVIHVKRNSTLDLGGNRIWLGSTGGIGTFIVESGGSYIRCGTFRFDEERGVGAQQLDLRPTGPGSAGLSAIETTTILSPEFATLHFNPQYRVAVGDSWEIMRWTNTLSAGGGSQVAFYDVVTPDGIEVEVDYGNTVEKTITLTVTRAPADLESYHAADMDRDGYIDTYELLRVIQLYNAGEYHCQAGTEDGYAPRSGPRDACAPHNSDYNPQNWQIALGELLRLVQIHNANGYDRCPDAGTEDGFCLFL